MSTLAFAGVTVRYGHGAAAHRAVNAVDLTVASGTVHGLVGESGSGKSTLAAAAVGLVRVAGGTIRLDDQDLTGGLAAARRARRRVQLVFQDPYSALDPHLPIGASIVEAMRVSAVRRTRAERARRVEELLDLVRIEPGRARDLPASFSGGQRQRVTIARALAAEPEVIIADEITSALDVSVQSVVLNLLRDLQRELRLTILFISHNLAVVRYMCDTVSVMRRGHLIESGDTEQTLVAPRHAYTRELLAAVPVMGRRPDWDA